MLTLFPAVDIRGGQSVRLFQGKAGSEKIYGSPVEVGRVLIGAGWLHLVDLDAAFGAVSYTHLTLPTSDLV